MDYQDESIGVLGSVPQRSEMDKRMQADFGGSLELYVSSGVGVVGPQDFGQRSVMDKKLQSEFNPYYKGAPSMKGMTEVPNRQYCISPGNCVPLENPPSGGRLKEQYCGGGGASSNSRMAASARLAPKGIASINADPSNLLNGKVRFMPLS